MKKYKSPDFHYVRNTGGLSGKELIKLSDDELSQYLHTDSYIKEKKKYRIKKGFILRNIAGQYTIIPVDEESVITNAMLVPNDTAVFLWKSFEKPSTIEDVVIKGLQEYDATEDVIRKATERFVKESLKQRILEEDE